MTFHSPWPCVIPLSVWDALTCFPSCHSCLQRHKGSGLVAGSTPFWGRPFPGPDAPLSGKWLPHLDVREKGPLLPGGVGRARRELGAAGWAPPAGFVKPVPGNHRLPHPNRARPQLCPPRLQAKQAVIWKGCFLSSCLLLPILTDYEHVA